MENHDLELLAHLHALSETDPVGVDGIPFDGTCQCAGILTIILTVCVGNTCNG
ncbi:VenA family class IV lanthipeptide [Streptomyces virginiae]|uniref:VenA family class IV lanthipeptide n=1 Tax=Streptomyces TaxID=1883 RepID=UPI000AE5A4F3|nr:MULTISPECIES: VenA family class IV lanthipeptide [Streptomyces]MCX4719196.1 VenA family class IV lanthipeptide [Streptomyces virginiae]WSC74941.1 VenA family class IV lanthipeptide [Streptomyces virginiae]